MKKLLLTGSLVMASLALASAQGTIKFFNVTAAFLVSTNGTGTGAGENGTTTGLTDKTSGDYYYALLYASSTPSSANLLTGGWTVSTSTGTNYSLSAGGIIGGGGASGGPIASTTAGNNYYLELVGYSASLASTMTLQQMLNAYYGTGQNWLASGYFGVSTYSGNTVTLGGSGSPPGPASAIFGSSLPITSGFDLNGVSPIPEPGTIALAGLGGLALLGLRRKK
jgi:hypothetical protein